MEFVGRTGPMESGLFAGLLPFVDGFLILAGMMVWSTGRWVPAWVGWNASARLLG
ncbi:MAG: hypothetical protein PWP23_3336 [Candidatus Sumerlaeota bacterium]|nr:hypothetical protein [Candidatus Sumerlaeota bacterium]